MSTTFESMATPDEVMSDGNFANEVAATIRAVVGPGRVALHEPTFIGNEWAYLKDCLDSTFVSSVGRYVDRFEAELAAFTGARHAVAVVNGTAALQVALRLAGVRAGDEVLMPALTFVATANAVSHVSATPHFVDSEMRTLGLDPAALREHLGRIAERRAGQCVNRATGKVIRAVVPMHVFGHPVDLDGLLSVTRDYRIAMVEDAAESLGSLYGDRHTGRFGMLGTLSFNGNKTITTGGGGAIITDDAELARQAKHLTTTAKRSHRWEFWHDDIGYNFRMPNLNAALGCAQLEQLPRLVEAKRALHARYAQAFAGVRGLSLVREPVGSHSNYWLQALLLDRPDLAMRDAVLTATNDGGLMTRPVWVLMHRMPQFSACPRAPLDVATRLEDSLINIPSSPVLGRPEGLVAGQGVRAPT